MNKNIICMNHDPDKQCEEKNSKRCVSGFYIAYFVSKNVDGLLATTWHRKEIKLGVRDI